MKKKKTSYLKKKKNYTYIHVLNIQVSMADARDFENIFLQMNKIFHKLCGIYFMFNDFIYIYIIY